MSSLPVNGPETGLAEGETVVFVPTARDLLAPGPKTHGAPKVINSRLLTHEAAHKVPRPFPQTRIGDPFCQQLKRGFLQAARPVVLPLRVKIWYKRQGSQWQIR